MIKEKAVIVILNYNDFETTNKILTNIYSYSLLDKIIVVDNCSTDDSYQKLLNNFSAISKITILQSNKNGGFSYGNLVGIRYAIEELCAKYIFVSNPDIVVSENTLSEIINTLTNNSSAVACAPYVKRLYTNEPCDYFFGGNFLYDFLMFLPFISRLVRKKLKEPLKDSTVEVKLLPGCFICLNSSIYDVTSLYDTELFLCYEEQVMSEKVHAAGLQLLLNSKVSVLHEESVTIKKNIHSIKKNKIVFNSFCTFYRKYKKTPFFLIMIARFIFNIVTRIRVLCYKGGN